MILDFPRDYVADATEQRLPDVAAARALLGERAAPLDHLIKRRREQFAAFVANAESDAVLARTEAALGVAYARQALRHGDLGDDFHAYHNEGHILDICGSRIDRLYETIGPAALSLRDWCALMLFGAGHDLRQREAAQPAASIGANERASTEETQRILDACGFLRGRDADLYLAIELMIAGSTFDARPLPGGYLFNAADLVQSGGALAATLDTLLDVQHPDWHSHPAVVRAQRLALIAADLDTANVAEPFQIFAHSGENLCREREMLSGRTLVAGESALPVLGFLTDGQERFFFDLHRFNSESGRAAFDAAKQANAAKLKALGMGVRARIALSGPPVNGNQVIAAYQATLANLAD